MGVARSVVTVKHCCGVGTSSDVKEPLSAGFVLLGNRASTPHGVSLNASHQSHCGADTEVLGTAPAV